MSNNLDKFNDEVWNNQTEAEQSTDQIEQSMYDAVSDIKKYTNKSREELRNKAVRNVQGKIKSKITGRGSPTKNPKIGLDKSIGSSVRNTTGGNNTRTAGQVIKSGGKAVTSGLKAVGRVGGVAARAGLQAASSAIAAIIPSLPLILGAIASILGVTLLIALITGSIVDNEFSRTNTANYYHMDVEETNNLLNSQLHANGNVFFNRATGRYELARGKMPTSGNKLYFAYYAAMSKNSQWFVEYEVNPDFDLDKPPSDENPYYILRTIPNNKKRYTLDGHLYSAINMDNVAERINYDEPISPDVAFSEEVYTYIEKLAMNVNLLYLLDSTLNGSMQGMGKNQLFFAEQFVKPVHHSQPIETTITTDKGWIKNVIASITGGNQRKVKLHGYDFKPLTQYREMTEQELERFSAAGRPVSGLSDTLTQTEEESGLANDAGYQDFKQNGRVHFIGDSLLAGLGGAIKSQMPNASVDGKVSRSFYGGSVEDGYQALANTPSNVDTLVISLGTNKSSFNSPAGISESELEAFVNEALKKAPNVALVTTGSGVSHRNEINEMIKRVASTKGNVSVIDWSAYVDQNGRSGIYGADDIHMDDASQFVDFLVKGSYGANTLGSSDTAENGPIEKEFQKKYRAWTIMVETQNINRGGSIASEGGSDSSASGVDNPLLARAMQIGKEWVDAGFTYSMESRMGPYSYDCSSFVSLVLKEAGMVGVPDWTFTTVTIIQNSDALGHNGTLFKEIRPRENAKKGAIVVAGGTGGIGGAGHTAFLAEDYHGPETKIMESTATVNGGTYELTMGGQIEWDPNWIAVEPVQQTLDGSDMPSNLQPGGPDTVTSPNGYTPSGKSDTSGGGGNGLGGRNMNRNLTMVYDEPVQSEWNGMISTGKLIAQSREFDVSYNPTIVPGNDKDGNIFRSQKLRYNIWRRDDFYLEEAPSGGSVSGDNPFGGPDNDGTRMTSQSGEYLDRIKNWPINSDDSSISAEDINRYLDQMNQPNRPIQPEFLGQGKKFKEIADKYGVNIVVLLGQMALETQLGYATCGGAEYNFGCMMYADWQNEKFGSTSIGDRPWSNPPNAWAGVEQQAYLVKFNYIDKGFIKYGEYLERYSPGFENHTDGPNSSSHNGFAKNVVQTGEMMGYDFPNNPKTKTPGSSTPSTGSARYHNKDKRGTDDIDGIGQLRSQLDIEGFADKIGNSAFTPNNGPVIGENGGAAKESVLTRQGSAAINVLNNYNEDRDDLMVWAMDRNFNPAHAVALISVLTDQGNKNLIGTKYNFLNDPDIVENIGGQGKQDLGITESPGENIEQLIKRIMSEVPAGIKWQVAVEPIGDAGIQSTSTGNEIGFQNSASTIKVGLAVAAYEAGLVGNGINEEDIRLMINQSDNQATNRVLDALGAKGRLIGSDDFTSVNEKLHAIGMKDTTVGRYMEVQSNNKNITTATDLAKLLANLDKFKGADKIKQFMSNNGTPGARLLSRLPQGATGINKSGENSGLRNDTAIISANNKSVAVAIMMESANGELSTDVNIGIMDEFQARLGEAVANVLLENKEEEEEDTSDEDENEESIDAEGQWQTDEHGMIFDSRYGSEYYANTYKVNDIYQGMDYVLDKIKSDNPEGKFTQEILMKNLGMEADEAREVFRLARSIGALTDDPNMPEGTGDNVKVFTYGGAGPEDEEGLGNVRIAGQLDETEVGGSKKYYTEDKDVPFGDAVLLKDGDQHAKAIKGQWVEPESNGWFGTWFGQTSKEYKPNMVTGIWDYGFGSIFKIAKQEYLAMPVYIDDEGRYRILPDTYFSQVKDFFQGNGTWNVAVSDNQYIMLGIVTPFGSINMMDEYVSEITKLNRILSKLAKGEILTKAEESVLKNHSEKELLVRDGVTDDGETKFTKRIASEEKSKSVFYKVVERDDDGNVIREYHEPEFADFYATNRVKKLDTKNKLRDTQGYQYLYDYLTNYEVYVPHITDQNLNVVERFRRMNDITMNEQEGVNHILDIFQKVFNDGTGGSSSSSKGGTGSTGEFGGMEENMKTVYNALTNAGLSSAAAVGLISNMVIESNVDPTAVFGVYDSPGVVNDAKKQVLDSNPSAPIGLIQWLGERRKALQDAAASKGVDWWDLDFQIDYLFKEPNHTEILPRMNQEPNTKEGARKAADGFFLVSEMHGGNMSFYDTNPHDDPLALANGPDRNSMKNIEKVWNAVVDKPIDSDDSKLSSNMGGASAGSSSSSSNSSGGQERSNTEVWGDGAGFKNNIYFAFNSINDSIMNIFGDNSRATDPTMFATMPTYNDTEFVAYWKTKMNRTLGWGKAVSGSSQRDATVNSNTQLYNNQGQPWGDKTLIINGADAYRWSKLTNKQSDEEARFVIRQFISVIESRDSRPAYYDEIYDRFDDYDESRIIEEYYKYNLLKIFQAQSSDTNDNWKSSDPAAINTESLTDNDEILEIVDGYNQSGTGYTLMGEAGMKVKNQRAGQVEYASGDTVIVRDDVLGLIAYHNLGTINVSEGQLIGKGAVIGTANAEGKFSISGLGSNSNISNGLNSVSKDDYRDVALDIGVKQNNSGPNPSPNQSGGNVDMQGTQNMNRMIEEVSKFQNTISNPNVRYINRELYLFDPNKNDFVRDENGNTIKIPKDFDININRYRLLPTN